MLYTNTDLGKHPDKVSTLDREQYFRKIASLEKIKEHHQQAERLYQMLQGKLFIVPM